MHDSYQFASFAASLPYIFKYFTFLKTKMMKIATFRNWANWLNSESKPKWSIHNIVPRTNIQGQEALDKKKYPPCLPWQNWCECSQYFIFESFAPSHASFFCYSGSLKTCKDNWVLNFSPSFTPCVAWRNFYHICKASWVNTDQFEFA